MSKVLDAAISRAEEGLRRASRREEQAYWDAFLALLKLVKAIGLVEDAIRHLRRAYAAIGLICQQRGVSDINGLRRFCDLLIEWIDDISVSMRSARDFTDELREEILEAFGLERRSNHNKKGG